MKETPIEEAIKLLQLLQKQNPIIEHLEITGGTTFKKRTIEDHEYCSEKVPDGSFCLSISGQVMKNY